MTDTTVRKQTLDAFIKQREKRQNDTGIEATKLVNLYRQLPLFGEDFLETYNKMLLDASPEVQMTLSDIVGGSVVRQYLEFLKSKQLRVEEDKQDAPVEDRLIYTTEGAFLPSADEMDVFNPSYQNPAVVEDGGDAPLSQDILKSQTAFFEQSLTKQSELIEKVLDKLQQNIQTNNTSEYRNASEDKQNLESQAVQLEVFKTSLQQLLETQNKVWADSMKQVLQQTGEMTLKQLQALENLIATQSDRKASYPIVEEYAPEGYVAKEYTRAHEPLKPYELSDVFPDEVRIKKDNKNTDLAIVTSDDDLQKDKEKKNSISAPAPKQMNDFKESDPLDDDVEILSEIDLPTGIL